MLALALGSKRAQGRPGARCTRGLVCNVHKEHAHEHTGPAESIRPSLRNGFTAYNVTLLGERLFCHRRSARSMFPGNLTPAPRRQDHTSLPYASAARRLSQPNASIASHRTFVTIAKRPS